MKEESTPFPVDKAASMRLIDGKYDSPSTQRCGLVTLFFETTHQLAALLLTSLLLSFTKVTMELTIFFSKASSKFERLSRAVTFMRSSRAMKLRGEG